jgi:hypothetical protein
VTDHGFPGSRGEGNEVIRVRLDEKQRNRTKRRRRV